MLVRNTFLSVDPYMRGRMNDVKSYVPPFRLDAPMDGGAVGEVVASSDESLAVGDTVLHQLGWREHALLPAPRPAASTRAGPGLGLPRRARHARPHRVRRAAPHRRSSRRATRCSSPGPPARSARVAGQLARLMGARKVVGTAGSAEKVAWLTDELGFDAAVNYKDGPVGKQLKAHAPFDVYFDNVGGDHLEAAIFHLNDNGRVAGVRRDRRVQRRRRRSPGPAT